MAIFEAENLVIRTGALDDARRGVRLEISFSGVHDHNWPAGERIHEFVEGEIRKARPAACLYDFLAYDYSWGNEIMGPIMAAIIYGSAPPLPVAIVAQGHTARSLKSLFAGSMLDKITDIGFFEDAQNARGFLEQALDKRRKPSSAGP
jgi:hypothetical protein